MRELDFNKDESQLIDYVVDKLHLAEAGDPEAIRYIEFLWGEDPELLDSSRAVFDLEIGG